MKWILTNLFLLICFYFIEIHPLVAALIVLFINGLYYFIEKMDRSHKVNQLNNYLSALNRGHQLTDVSNYDEGELSVLQAELYKLSVTLSHQNEMLLQKQTFVQDSLNDIAHQIKTPLTSMMVMTDLMLETDVPAEKQAEFVKLMQNQLERLKLLITNLMTLSKLDAGVITYHPSWIKDTDLFEKVLNSFQVIAELKEITMDCETTGEEVYIDATWMVEALSNLVKNAIEHSPSPSTLKIQSSINQLYWRIVVENEGQGIDAEDLNHIFERFYRGKNSSTDSVGIGLSLTEKIITQQQGRINVESIPNQFTRFKIEFYHKPRRKV